MSDEEVLKLYKDREELIRLEAENPLLYGYEIPRWRMADEQLHEKDELLILGGNRSGKSEYAAKRVVQAAMNNPNSVIWCYQTTFENSVQMQQKMIWKYLPPEIKNIGRSRVASVSYSQKRGFTDAKLVLPNGSEIIFRNFSQDISTIEGGEIGCASFKADPERPWLHNIGCWLDEAFNQADWVSGLRFRLVTRASKMIITFTAVDGYTPIVKEYLNGAVTKVSCEADLIPTAA